VIIHVLPAGLSRALHEHHFQPESWSGEISWDPEHPAAPGRSAVRGRLASRSAVEALGPGSRRSRARPGARASHPAKKFPKIEFRAETAEVSRPPGADGSFQGTLAGSLTLHGQTRPLRLEVKGRIAEGRLEASAIASFKQSDFGMKPYKTALGAIAVRDEVAVEIAIRLPR
jgi:hypothetical protein